MIRIAITAAICSTVPKDAPLQPVPRREGQIHVKAAVLDRLGAMRGVGASYSDVVLGLVER